MTVLVNDRLLTDDRTEANTLVALDASVRLETDDMTLFRIDAITDVKLRLDVEEMYLPLMTDASADKDAATDAARVEADTRRAVADNDNKAVGLLAEASARVADAVSERLAVDVELVLAPVVKTTDASLESVPSTPAVTKATL